MVARTNYLWVVEVKDYEEFKNWTTTVGAGITRDQARDMAIDFKDQGFKTRIRRYVREG